jgi:plasmid stabilization system protein ParE
MPEVKADIKSIFSKIAYGFKQPLTARRYRNGLLKAIRRLPVYADSIAFSRYDYIQSRYGPNARHITYKKMVIIYTITGNTIFIKRVMSANLIR